MPYKIFTYNHPLRLESGAELPSYELAYTTHGTLNEKGDNVVWIFHALTANSDPAEWWPGLVGEGKLFDPANHFIVCVNMPGSCYGSIGPLNINPMNHEPYYHDFPFFTTRDMIRAYQPLKSFLGIEKIQMGIGGSMGGQQLLEWAIWNLICLNLYSPLPPMPSILPGELRLMNPSEWHRSGWNLERKKCPGGHGRHESGTGNCPDLLPPL